MPFLVFLKYLFIGRKSSSLPTGHVLVTYLGLLPHSVPMLFGIRGSRREVNAEILSRALESSPSLFVDAANCANIHALPADPRFKDVFVVPTESLYRFKPTLLRLPVLADQLGTSNIFISAIPHLFDFDNEYETKLVIEQCWRIIDWVARKFNVTVGIVPGSVHEVLFRGSYEMGHTVWSQRMNSDSILSDLERFGRSLGKDERLIYSRLLKRPLKHLGSISYASPYHTWAFLLLTMMLEQEKRLEEVERLAFGRIQGGQ